MTTVSWFSWQRIGTLRRQTHFIPGVVHSSKKSPNIPGCLRLSTQPRTNPDYCVNLVKSHCMLCGDWKEISRGISENSFRKVSGLEKNYDYENYLCCLLLPRKVQRAAFSIRAFNIEIAQVRDVVSEKTVGAMRMQFWKDSLDQVFEGTPPETPVAMELAGAVKYFKLSKRWFSRIIKARSEQLEVDSYQTVQDVEKYAEDTASSLHYLLLECLGVKNIHADHAASHIGKAQGLTILLRAAPYHAQRRRVYLPLETIVKHKVSQEDVIRGRVGQNLQDAIFDIASLANQHLNKARSLQKDVPKDAFVAFLNTVPCDHYLKRLQLANFNVFDPKLQQRNTTLPVQLWLQKLQKKF